MTQRTLAGATDTFQYDTLGRKIAATNALGAWSYTYLGQTNQLLKQSIGSAGGTTFSYEPNTGDRRLRTLTSQGKARDFTYQTNAADLIKTMTDTASADGAAARTWTNSYDAADRVLKVASSAGAATAYAYDLADNITTWQAPSGNKTATYNLSLIHI